MNRKITFAASLILALALSFPVPCAVGDITEERLKRFELFCDCSPVGLSISNLSSDAKKLGLTREAVQANLESRLRSARLYTSDGLESYVFVSVNVVGNAFSIELQFKKLVYDRFSGNTFFAVTWETGSTGTHGGRADYILSSISQAMDRFLLNFLRVNEDACEKRFSLPKK